MGSVGTQMHFRHLQPRASDARPPEMVTWPAETVQRFLMLMEGDRYAPPFTMLATTGMRRGEVLGFRWSDLEMPKVGMSVARIRQTTTAMAVTDLALLTAYLDRCSSRGRDG